jgi:hypothetical protein
LAAEDAKLFTLARAALARLGVTEAAAVRDDTGRTYVAGPVALPSLALSALQSVVAVAVASGATRLEAAVLLGPAELDPAGASAVGDLLMAGGGLYLGDRAGALISRAP